MAVNQQFFNSFTITRDQVNELGIETLYSVDGNIDFSYVLLGNSGGNTDNYRFFQYNITSMAGSLAFKHDLTTNGTVRYTGNNAGSLSASACLTATNGGTLLTLANREAVNELYFDGVQQTASSLYDYMVDRYGAYEGFYYQTVAGGQIGETWSSNPGTLRKITFDHGQAAPNTVYPWNFPSDIDLGTGGEIYIPEDANTVELLAAFIIFGEPVAPEKLAFDVYIDGVIGEKAPQFTIKFRNTKTGSELAESMITPKIWGWPVPQEGAPALVSTPPIVTIDGIKVPNETDPNHSRTQYNGSFEFTGSFASPYITLSDSMIGWRSSLDQISFFGPDRICDTIRLYLRFDYVVDNNGTGVLTWGDLYYVDIPYEYQGAAYILPFSVSDSSNNPRFLTEVNIIGGLPPEDETDDDETPPGEDKEGDPSGDGPYAPDGYVDLSDGEPNGFDGDAVLTTTYAMPKLTMQSVGADLWSQQYFNVLKIQTNPIENIIACKWYPMSLSGTPNTPIKIGDITLGVSADKIGTMYIKSFGSYKHETKDPERPGYLSMTPYCIVKLHLPYVGVVQLDATEIYKQTLTGKYVVDLITGDVLVILYLDGNPYMTLTGKMGVDIPLTSTNRVQTELASAARTFSATVGAAGALAGGNVDKALGSGASGIMSIMGMDYSSQRCTSHSPACCTYENLWIFITVQYNPSSKSKGYTNQRGLPVHLYQTLSYMKSKGCGFIQVDGRTTINVAMTDEENRMLEEIMTSGFYL